MSAFIAALAAVCFYMVGWLSAHQTVAEECRTLGGFYVGSTVYECKPAPKLREKNS